VELNVSLQNVGQDLAAGVVANLSCNHEDITIINGEAGFGDIQGNASETLEAAFTIAASNSIANLSQITFEIHISSGDNEWMSPMNITALAPELSLIGFDLDDSQGDNNGRLDPGESVIFSIDFINHGNSMSPPIQTHLTTASDFIEIINPDQSQTVLDINEEANLEFEIQVSNDCSTGDVAHLLMNLSGGAYTDFMSYYLPVGLQVEDWESGNFEQYEWYSEGNANWVLTTNNPYEGEYCSESGSISDSQTSSMIIDLNVLNQDTISFYYKVSSETDFDFLRFNIDENEMDKWSGEVDWTRKAYPINPGAHSFSWIYTKDGSVSSGQDKGYVDYIVFPAMGIISATEDMQSGLEMDFFPNPAQDKAYLQLYSQRDQYVSIQIIDQQGRSVQHFNQHLAIGNQQIDLSVVSLDAGVYSIVISNETAIEQIRFIKM
jgi:hypothetical protein